MRSRAPLERPSFANAPVRRFHPPQRNVPQAREAAQLAPHVGVALSLFTDGGGGPMSRDHEGLAVQHIELPTDALLQQVPAAAPQVRTTDATAEERVSRQQHLTLLEGAVEAAGTRSVARRVQRRQLQVPVARAEVPHVRLGDGRHAEPLGLLGQGLDEEPIFAMQVRRTLPEILELPRGAHMVKVGVGVKQGGDREAQGLHPLADLGPVAAGVHHHPESCGGLPEQGAVTAQRAYGEGFETQHPTSVDQTRRPWLPAIGSPRPAGG